MALRQTLTYNEYRGHVLLVDAAVEPITKDQVKAQLKIDGTDEDETLDLYIKASRQYLENLTGLACIDQQWKLVLDRWPAQQDQWWDGVRQGSINELQTSGRAADTLIPRYPLQKIDSMVVDGNTINTDDFFIVDTFQRPGRLRLKRGRTYPVINDQSANAIQIEYQSGYGPAPVDVPEPLKLGLIMMVAHLYTFRGDNCSTDDAAKNSGALRAWQSYKALQL